MRRCKYCENEFEPNTANQIYDTPECTRLATNKRIMDNYYAKKANREGKERVCAYNACETKLSRYNDSDHCSVHESLQMDVSFMREWV